MLVSGEKTYNTKQNIIIFNKSKFLEYTSKKNNKVKINKIKIWFKIIFRHLMNIIILLC